jgi:integrase
MASIHERLGKGGKKRWLVYWREPTGIQRAKTLARYGDAKDFRREVEPREKLKLLPTVDLNITVKEYAERWLKIVEPTLEESTWASYETTLRVHVCTPPLETAEVRYLRPGHLREFLAQKMAEGLSVETVRRIHAVLRAMLEWAVDQDVLLENPASKLGRKLGLVRSKRQRQEEKNPLTREERDLFHDVCARVDAKMFPLFFTLERAGLRLGECLILRVDDLDLKRREMRVARSLSSFNRRTKACKSGHGRTVEMSTQLCRVLAEVVSRRRREGLAKGDTNPLLFPSGRGTPYWHGNVERRFSRVLRAAGLPTHHTPHDMRHTFASLHLEEGADIQWLQRQMGHASVQTSVDEYGRWWKARSRGQADRLDAPAIPSGDAAVSKSGGLLAEPAPPAPQRDDGSD